MALQLGFTWNQDPSSFKPKIEKFEPIRRENYELPVSLDFKVCVPPQITQELPQPMKFSNKPPSPRKLVQYTQISKKKPKTGLGPAILKKPKFSNFSGLSKDKLKKPLKNKPVKNHPKVAVKPEWNDNTIGVGLFDLKISKKVPIEIKHALNKNLTEVSKERMAPPTVFQNWDEIPRPVSKSIPKRINKKEEQIVRQKEILLKDNLSVKFIEDQEEMVRRLEKQLEHERKARKELDYQFTDKMKELEKFKVLDQEIKAAKDHYSKQQIKESSPKISRSKSANKSMGPMVIKAPAHRPTTHQDLKSYYFQTEDAPKLKKVTSEELLSHIEIAKESLEEENIILDRNGGNIFEIPTRDSHKPLVMKKPEEWIKPKNMAQESQKYLQKEKQVTINPNPVTINSTPVFQRPESAPLAKNFEITEMRSKMDPLLNALSSTITRLNCSEKYGSHTGIGLISRVSAKYIAYYAEDLSDLILDDILIDITQELQEIDQKESQKNMSEFKAESEKFVDDLIKGFHEQTVELQEKYSKPKPEKRILVLEEEAEIVIEDVRRLWSIDIDEKVMKSINLYKREMQKYQDVYGGGSQGKLWEIYEIVGDDFVEEAFNDAVEDYLNVFDEYTDKIIGQEFL